MNGSELPKKVAENTRLFRTKMTQAGFSVAVSQPFVDPTKNLKTQLIVKMLFEMLTIIVRRKMLMIFVIVS